MLYAPMDVPPGRLGVRAMRAYAAVVGHLLPANGTISHPAVSTTQARITVTSPDDGHEAEVLVLESEQAARRLTDGTPRGALLWVHGGGHLAGAANVLGRGVLRAADELGLLVVSVEYRLSVDAPFPADLDDCYAALRWLQQGAPDLGVDPARIAVGGESAGGGIAAALVQRATDAGHPVAFQSLVYPELDDRAGLRASAPGEPRARGRLVWTRNMDVAAWRIYLGREPGDDSVPAYAAPGRREDLSGLAPAWIGVGDLDLFHDDCLAYARRLEGAGIPVELVTVPGMYHGADVPPLGSAEMDRFHASFVQALRRGLAL